MSDLNMSARQSYIPLDEVRRHSTDDDCWIIVHSQIYNVSDFHAEHPGGAAIILKYAGGDATAAYDEIHAPGIIGDTLPEDCLVGLINAREMEELREETQAITQETASLRAANLQEPLPVASSGPKAYEKPDLFKLISVHDFEDVARNTLTQKAWAFFSSAATDLVTHHNNSDYYKKIMIRPRILRSVKDISIRRTIMGCESSSPFFISPAAMAKLAHPEGELALARGAAAENIIQCISSNASYPLEEIVRAGVPNQPFFLQLYVNSDRPKSAKLLHQARKLGIKAIFVTVDAPVPGKREADERIATQSNVVSAISGARGDNDKKGGGMGRLMAKYVDSTLNWEDIRWIRETSGLPVVLKGVQTAADAKKAVEYGCAGIMLSNHGGRSLDTAPPAILALMELHKTVPEVFGKIEIYIDGGVTRGTDILKALALGATAVGVGRPYLYSLTYGADGVEHLTSILKDELTTSMKLAGITDVDHLHPGILNTGAIDHMVLGGNDHPYIKWKPRSML